MAAQSEQGEVWSNRKKNDNPSEFKRDLEERTADPMTEQEARAFEQEVIRGIQATKRTKEKKVRAFLQGGSSSSASGEPSSSSSSSSSLSSSSSSSSEDSSDEEDGKNFAQQLRKANEIVKTRMESYAKRKRRAKQKGSKRAGASSSSAASKKAKRELYSNLRF